MSQIHKTNEIGIDCICGHVYCATPILGKLTCPKCNHVWDLQGSNVLYDKQAAEERVRIAIQKARDNAKMTLEEWFKDVARRLGDNHENH